MVRLVTVVHWIGQSGLMHTFGHLTLYLSSCGVHKLLAPIFNPPATSSSAASSLLLALIISSHALSPQNGTRSKLPLFKFGLKSFQSSTFTSLVSRSFKAFGYPM